MTEGELEAEVERLRCEVEDRIFQALRYMGALEQIGWYETNKGIKDANNRIGLALKEIKTIARVALGPNYKRPRAKETSV